MENKTCTVCLEEKPLQKFNKRTLPSGNVKLRSRCRKCSKKAARDAGWESEEAKAKAKIARRARYLRNEDRTDPARRARYLLTDSNLSDQKRGLTNDLTIEDVERLTSQPCSYCGDTEIIVTLDRIDNSLAHDLSNVVPACYRCNMARGSMPYEAWLYLKEGLRAARVAGAFGNWRSSPISRKMVAGMGIEPI